MPVPMAWLRSRGIIEFIPEDVAENDLQNAIPLLSHELGGHAIASLLQARTDFTDTISMMWSSVLVTTTKRSASSSCTKVGTCLV